MLDLGLFRIKQFTGSSMAILFNAISWGAVLILVSLYLQLVRGFSPSQAGLTLVPFQIAVLSTGPLSGRFSDKYGRRPFTVSGLAIQGIAVVLFSTLTNSDSLSLVIGYMVMIWNR